LPASKTNTTAKVVAGERTPQAPLGDYFGGDADESFSPFFPFHYNKIDMIFPPLPLCLATAGAIRVMSTMTSAETILSTRRAPQAKA